MRRLGITAIASDDDGIERRGKPVGAIVSAEDLGRLEAEAPPVPRRGLLAAVGVLADIEGFDEILADI